MATWLQMECAPTGERVLLLIAHKGVSEVVFATLLEGSWKSDDGKEIKAKPMGWWPLATSNTAPPGPLNPE